MVGWGARGEKGRDIHHRQDTFVVKTPPIRGPATEATPKIAPRNPVHIGRFCSGTLCMIITIAPEETPADPSPAMARPRMKAVEFGAAPQITEPSSKRPMTARKTYFGE